MNCLADEQSRRNRESRDHWVTFTSHREQVTNLLCRCAPSLDSRLLVLGAGNCNDLDLHRLLNQYRQVTLTDIDTSALEAGITRQGLQSGPRLLLRGGVDLTGVLEIMDSWRDGPVEDSSIDRCVDILERWHLDGLGGNFDVTVSVCTVSQLLEPLSATLGPGHPRFVELVELVRAHHLRLMLESLRPSGVGVLITDVVSSDSLPALLSVNADQLRMLVAEQVMRGNFFHGLSPFRLLQLLREGSAGGEPIGTPEYVPPWLWHFGPRVYAVCGFVFHRE